MFTAVCSEITSQIKQQRAASRLRARTDCQHGEPWRERYRRPSSCNSVYRSPVAAVTNGHETRGSHQQEPILMAGETRSPQWRCQLGHAPPCGAGADAIPHPSCILGAQHPLAVAASLHSCLCPHVASPLLSLLCVSVRTPVAGGRATWIIQEDLLLRSLPSWLLQRCFSQIRSQSLEGLG